jgi:hypothetical protein
VIINSGNTGRDKWTDTINYICYFLLIGKHLQRNTFPKLRNGFLNFIQPREFRHELIFLYFFINIPMKAAVYAPSTMGTRARHRELVT